MKYACSGTVCCSSIQRRIYKAVQRWYRKSAYALLFGGTDEGRDLAPRVAARTRTGLTVDCTEFRIDEEIRCAKSARHLEAV